MNFDRVTIEKDEISKHSSKLSKSEIQKRLIDVYNEINEDTEEFIFYLTSLDNITGTKKIVNVAFMKPTSWFDFINENMRGIILEK